MIDFLKRLFCKHYKVEFVRNIYGDEILEYGYNRSIWKCSECGALGLSKALHNTGADI